MLTVRDSPNANGSILTQVATLLTLLLFTMYQIFFHHYIIKRDFFPHIIEKWKKKQFPPYNNGLEKDVDQAFKQTLSCNFYEGNNAALHIYEG